MNNQDVIDNGRKLYQSAENLRKAALDLDAMLLSLWEIVSEATFAGGEIQELADEGGSAGDWMIPAYAYNAAVMSLAERAPGQRGPSKKPKQIGTITILARLCNSDDIDGEAPDWPWLDQSCLILGWHPEEHPDDNWEVGNFSPDDESRASISHLGDGLWSWRDEGGENDYAYFFVLPIFAFRDESDLKRFALSPLKRLFGADNPSAEAVVAFHNVPVLLPLSV